MDERDSLWGRVKQLARLGGIVAVATASLALSYCSHNQTKSDSSPPDLRTTPDARPDANAPDAGPPAPDGAKGDAKTDSAAPKPDARLWDVLCE